MRVFPAKTLTRLQFAFTVSLHIIFLAFSIGLATSDHSGGWTLQTDDIDALVSSRGIKGLVQLAQCLLAFMPF